MKRTHCLLALPFTCLLLIGTARAESADETLKTLPAPVQKTIKTEGKHKTLVKIEAKEKDGKTRYKVVMKAPDGMQKRLFVDGSGKVLRLKNDVAVDSLPAPVRKTVEAQGQGAKFVRSTKVTHDGKTEYEAEWDNGGRSKVVLMDPAGKVEKTEEVVAVTTLPAPARAQVEKDVGGGKLLKVEAITDAGKPTIYEAQFEAGGKKSEIKLGADGKVLGRE